MAHLLFIDDEEVMLDLQRQVADNLGHTSVTARDGREGLDVLMLLRPEPDVIFVNGAMPRMGGIEFLRAARPYVHNRIPCIFDSGYDAGGSESTAAREAGAVGHLVRPWGLAEHRDCLDRALLLRTVYRGGNRGRPGEPRITSGTVARYRDGGRFRVPSPKAAWHVLSHLFDVASPEEGPWVEPADVWLDSPRPSFWRAVAPGLTVDRDDDVPDSARAALMLLDLAADEIGFRTGRFSWRFPNGISMECAAPSVMHLRRGELLHAGAGPALLYEDGFRVFAACGTVLPRRLVEEPETVTVEDIRGQENVELRRWLRERYGHSRYLLDTGARVVDADSVPVDALAHGGPTLTRALLVDHEQRRWLVASDGSTRRVYHMEVPRDCSTCKGAYGALSGRPGMRTIVEA